jgi:hypothetical protein
VPVTGKRFTGEGRLAWFDGTHRCAAPRTSIENPDEH